MANLFTLMGTILIDNTKANESISKTAEKAASFAGKLISGAATAVKWGATVATAAAGAAVALGTTALKSAADFEQQMSNVGTLLSGDSDSVSARMQELGDAVKDMSSDTAVSTDLLTDGLYQVISALGDSSDSMSILETAAKGAKAGNATVTDSVNLLSAVMKGYNDVSADAASKTSDLAFKTVKLGQTSFPELASSMGKVIPLASTLNVSQEELFNTYATLTGVTGTAAEVTTQMKAALTGLMSPTKDMQEKMKGLGYESGDAMIKALGLEGSFLALKESCGGSDIALAKLFSSTEAQTAVMALAGAQADTYNQKMKEMSDAAGATETAFQMQTDNFNSRIDSIKNKMDVLSITIGEKLLPIANDIAAWVDEHFPEMEAVVTGAVDMISDGVGIMQDLFAEATELIDSEVKPRIDNFSGALEKLYDATEPVRSAFSDLISPLTESSQQFDIVRAAVDALSWVLDTATGAANFLADGVASVAGDAAEAMQDFAENVLPKVSEKLEEAQSFFQALSDKTGEFIDNLKPVADLIRDNFLSSLENLKEPMNTIKESFGKIGGALVELEPFLAIVAGILGGVLADAFAIAVGAINGIVSAIDGFATMISGVVEIVAGVFGLIVGIFTGNADLCNEAIQGIYDGVCNVFGGLWDAVSGFVSGFVEGVVGFFQGLWDTLVGHSIVPDTIDGIINCFAGLWEGVSGFVSGFVDGVTGAFISMKETAVEKFNALKEKITKTATETKEKAVTAFDSLKESASNAFTRTKEKASSAFDTLKNKVTTAANAAYSKSKDSFDRLKASVGTAMDAAKSATSTASAKMKDSITDMATNAASKVSSKFEAIGSKISSVMRDAKTAVSNGIENIKKKFNFSWSLPELKLPHPRVTGKFSLNPPSVPDFSIKWYREAMDNGIIMNSPTIFGYNAKTGQFQAGGEAGSETVVGTESLMEMIRDAVAAQNAALLQRVDRLITLLVKFFPEVLEAMDKDVVLNDGTLVGKLAPGMNVELGKKSNKDGRKT